MPEINFSATVIGCVTAMAEAFGKTVTEHTFRAYEAGLAGLSAEDVATATQQALEKCRFMPAPVELREFLVMRLEDRASKAWAAVETAMRRYSFYDSVDFDDPVINAVILSFGGWEKISVIGEDDSREWYTFFRKDFERVYVSYFRAGISEEQAAPLIGHHDRVNGLKGYGQNTAAKIITGLPPVEVRKSRITGSNRPANIPRLELKQA